LVVADAAWRSAGAAGEIMARVAERSFHHLRAPMTRVTLPDVPAPSSASEEDAYYPTSDDIVDACERVLGYDQRGARLRAHSVGASITVGN
jgi:pyruvate dehydrogenase E1 component beta subunit